MDTQSYQSVQPGVGMEENFLSLDDILLSHERLPIRTECTFPRLGFLEKSSDTQDIPEVGKVTEGKCMNVVIVLIHLEITVSLRCTGLFLKRNLDQTSLNTLQFILTLP